MARKFERPYTLAIDIGGTNIKALVLDKRARHVGKRVVEATPKPGSPSAIYRLIKNMATQMPAFDRVSVGFPGVVRNGTVETAPNLDAAWVKTKIDSRLARVLGKPTKAANDADVHGLGVIKGKGVELMITLGTGMGVALFADGKLVPNVELWHHPFRNDKSYEDYLGMKGLKRHGEEKWKKSLKRALETLRHTFNYDQLYLSGGHTHLIDFKLPSKVKITTHLAGHYGGVALWN